MQARTRGPAASRLIAKRFRAAAWGVLFTAVLGVAHRRRISRSRAFRRRARRLHVRDALRDVRNHLSVRDVAAAAADAHVLAARLAGISHAAPGHKVAQLSRRLFLEFAANRFIFRRGALRGARTG